MNDNMQARIHSRYGYITRPTPHGTHEFVILDHASGDELFAYGGFHSAEDAVHAADGLLAWDVHLTRALRAYGTQSSADAEDAALAVMLHDVRDQQQALAADGDPATATNDWSAKVESKRRRVHMGRHGKRYRYEIVHIDGGIRFVIYEDLARIHSEWGYDDFDAAEAAAIRWIDMNS